MLLATSNTQGELSALERGMHALGSSLDVKAYAASVGREKEYQTVRHERLAAAVAASVINVYNDLSAHYQKLVEIHTAAPWLWPALVAAMTLAHHQQNFAFIIQGA